MGLNELKEQWLSLFPESHNGNDAKRFIRYAIALAREDGVLDLDEMENRGISRQHIREYQRQYEFLRYVLDVLDER